MNLAIEYIKRSKTSQRMLNLPFSLFLDHKEKPLVVGVFKENSNHLLVKHWNLLQWDKTKILPPCEEYIVDISTVLNSPFIIVEDYKLLPYEAAPLPITPKQYSDEPYASSQEKQYINGMDNFFNTSVNQLLRINWLWNKFLLCFFPESYEEYLSRFNSNEQRIVMQDNAPIPWKAWEKWQATFMFNELTPFAVELIYEDLFKN